MAFPTCMVSPYTLVVFYTKSVPQLSCKRDVTDLATLGGETVCAWQLDLPNTHCTMGSLFNTCYRQMNQVGWGLSKVPLKWMKIIIQQCPVDVLAALILPCCKMESFFCSSQRAAHRMHPPTHRETDADGANCFVKVTQQDRSGAGNRIPGT